MRVFFFFLNNKLYLFSPRSLLLGYFRTRLVYDDALLANTRGESDSTSVVSSSHVWSIGQKASALSFADPCVWIIGLPLWEKLRGSNLREKARESAKVFAFFIFAWLFSKAYDASNKPGSFMTTAKKRNVEKRCNSRYLTKRIEAIERINIIVLSLFI